MSHDVVLLDHDTLIVPISAARLPADPGSPNLTHILARELAFLSKGIRISESLRIPDAFTNVSDVTTGMTT
jgi:hypothetical protein